MAHDPSRIPDLQTMASFIVDSASLGIMAVDREERVLFFNREAGRICGMDPSAVVGRPVAEVFPDLPDEARIVQRALRERRSFRDVRQQYHYRGADWHLNTTAEVVRNDVGEIVGAVAMFTDASDLATLERRARDAEWLASVGRMAAGTVHEIRNPLTTIRGFVQLFADRFDALGQAADARLARMVLTEIDRSTRLLSEFLQLTRPTVDGWRLASIVPVVKEAIDLLVTGREGAPATSVDLAPLPDVFANPDRIRQVVTNLWQNAADAAGPHGHISVAARPASDVAVIEISDDGPGLSPLIATHLFEPFFTTKELGTGLGLVICKRIVEDHGGTLTVSNRPGGGTVARFTLPLPAVPER
ncbi:MAG: two-component system sensor histidine kinase NtrB [Chloroflexota bacterium]